MMGRQVNQGALFYEVRLEDRVPSGSPALRLPSPMAQDGPMT